MLKHFRRVFLIPLIIILGFASVIGSGGGGGSEKVNSLPNANAGPDQTVDAQSLVVLNGAGSSDPDGMITGYQWTQTSGQSVRINRANEVRGLFVAPLVSGRSVLIFELRATDNDGRSTTDTVTITVIPPALLDVPNSAPIANAGLDQTVAAQTTVILNGSASSDTDGNITVYQWTKISGPTVLIINSNQAQASFTAPNLAADTDFIFQLRVTDDDGGSAADTVTITVLSGPRFVLSGSISVPVGTATDSDVNNPDDSYTSNDTPQLAQSIQNPVTVGGYVNISGTGEDGRSQAIGDRNDYFQVELVVGQNITLLVADSDIGDVDLYLHDSSGNIVDASVGAGQTENLEVPADGNYFVRVFAFSGASNYNLIIGQTQGNRVGGSYRLSDDFVVGQAVMKYKPGLSLSAKGAVTQPFQSKLGFHVLSGEPRRALLLELDSGADISGTLESQANDEFIAGFAGRFAAGDRRKWETLIAIKKLNQEPLVEYAEPNYIRRTTATPNDQFYSFQWHYPLINLPSAWDLTTGVSTVTVAVIDSGVLLNHPDLQGQLVSGYDFIRDTANALDGNGIDPDPNDPGDGGVGQRSSFHGTHVAGTIGARSNNSIGVAGVAWDTKLMPLRVCGLFGCSNYDVAQAVRYAAGLSNDSGLVANPPVDVINLSLGGVGFSQVGQDTVTAAHQAGVVIVASAGNEASSQLFYPASYDKVISVSAVGPARTRAPYSSFGVAVDIAAPGGDATLDLNGDGYIDGVLSTLADDSGSFEWVYAFYQGTSMASPHVAGVIALMKSVNVNLTPGQIDQLLIQGDLSDDLGDFGRDDFYGYGLINAQKAVVAALSAAGNPPVENPNLSVTPSSLNFDAGTSIIEIAVSNTGGGTLQNISFNIGASWIGITPSNIDANGSGSYVVTVDRSGLTDGIYSATISVISNVNVVNIAVIMAVGDAFVGNVGRIYVLLIDSATSDVIAWDEVDASGGIYRYQLLDVPPGDYVIMAGADMDNDLFICDSGEACSLYPTWNNPTVVNVDRDITNLDFSVGYILAVPETQSVGPPGEVLSPLPTLRPHISADDRTGVERGHD